MCKKWYEELALIGKIRIPTPLYYETGHRTNKITLLSTSLGQPASDVMNVGLVYHRYLGSYI